MKVKRMKEMFSKLKNPKNVKTNSPCQHLRNSIETSKEIIHTDVRVNTVLMQQSKHLHRFFVGMSGKCTLKEENLSWPRSIAG